MGKSGQIDFNDNESIKKIAKDTNKSINKNIKGTDEVSPKIMEFIIKHHKPLIIFAVWFILFGIGSNIYYLVRFTKFIINLF